MNIDHDPKQKILEQKMENTKDKTFVNLDPKVQELYAELTEEKAKTAKLTEVLKWNEQLVAENSELSAKVDQYKEMSASANQSKIETDIKVQGLQNQHASRDEIEESYKKRLNILLDSLSDHDEVQESDTKAINEIREALNSFIRGRDLRSKMITKMKKQRQELMDENENLILMRSSLTHDLRSLMSSILGALMLLDFDNQDALERLVPQLKKKCNIFLELMDTINSSEIQKVEFTISDIMEMLNLESESASDPINFNISGEEQLIYGDKAAIYDVLQNLINNSIKYSGKAGKKLQINLDIHQDQDMVIIEIADNGSGVPERSRKGIFELYNRGDMKDDKGKGIGLFMVKTLIEKHKGLIQYDSDYKKGAKFKISLPTE